MAHSDAVTEAHATAMRLPIKTILETVFVSFIPTLLTYLSSFQQLEHWQTIGICIAVFTLLFVLMYLKSVDEYRKAVVEVLAAGYYFNCIEALSAILHSAKAHAIRLGDGTERLIPTEKIGVEIWIPKDEQDFVFLHTGNPLNTETVQIKNHGDGASRYFKAQVKGDQITLVDMPNTLSSLPRY